MPRRDVTTDEVMRQMDVRHRKRQSSIDSAQRTKENQSVSLLDGLGDKVEVSSSYNFITIYPF
ncbi:hypothetical protein QUF74_15550 [Candidatus Halobeggiatoa sp. HSG11]|nr:hypothetical protein [Candidatus Halobeggiatoa sp. HSG11]